MAQVMPTSGGSEADAPILGNPPAPPANRDYAARLRSALTLAGSKLPTSLFLVRWGFPLVFLVIVLRSLDISPVAWWRRWYPPEGFIMVDSPEIYTRERLINERLEEDIWLTERLKEADDDASLIGVRRLIDRKLHIGEPPAPPPVTPAGATSKPAAGSAEIETKSSESMSAATDLLTFDQKVSVKSANRDFILQKLIENRLDDRHDLEGNSLYVLKFDTTVLVNALSNKKAIVGIHLVPPVQSSTDASSREPVNSNFIKAGLREDEETLRFVRRSFEQFMKDASDRLNSAIYKILSDTSGRRDLDTKIKVASAQEFGVFEGDIEVLIQDIATPDNKPVQRQYRLQIGRMADYFEFNAVIPIEDVSGKPPVFSAFEKSTNFELVDERCIRTKEARSGTSNNYTIEYRLPLQDAETLKTYFASGTSFARYYSNINGYFMSDAARASAFMELLDKSTAGPLKRGSSEIKTWGRLEWKSYDPAKPQDKMTWLSNERLGLCRAIKGSLNIGFLRFVDNVMSYNSYAYSVLPRQSAISVIDEVVESSSARVLAGHSEGWLGSLGLGGLASGYSKSSTGASLQNRVTSFGDVTGNTRLPKDEIAVGWIIDPKAGRIAPERDELISSTDSVMAIVSVPSWWPHLKVQVVRKWLNADGSREPATNSSNLYIKDSASRTQDTAESEDEVTVNLPNAQQLIESSIISGERRIPRVADAICEQRTKVQDEKPETILTCIITGRRLWRNTVVTLGTLRHKTLKVMPNMDGLIVEFESDARDCDKTLQVWTSEGVASSTKQLCITPASTQPATTNEVRP